MTEGPPTNLLSFVYWAFGGIGVVLVAFLVRQLNRSKLFRKTIRRLVLTLSRYSAEPHVESFPGHDDGTYNTEFYDYFNAQIRNARQNIYLTGEGFECADIEGTQLATDFASSLRHALQNGVNIVRVQTRSDTDSEWTELLSSLKAQFPSLLEIYVLQAEKVARMSSFCVIDPDDTTHCLVEIMISTQRSFGLRAADLAGTAVFIHGKQNLARDVRKRILHLLQPDVSMQLRTPEAVKKYLGGWVYSFAYGRNMSSAAFTDRLDTAEKVTRGVLLDHQLVFNRKGSYRDGGVASVVPAEGKRVYGIIWKVPAADLADLDEIEDVPAAYKRVTKTVNSLDGEKHSCEVYVSIPEGNLEPDPEYLNLLIEAAENADLPQDYLTYLQSFKRS